MMLVVSVCESVCHSVVCFSLPLSLSLGAAETALMFPLPLFFCRLLAAAALIPYLRMDGAGYHSNIIKIVKTPRICTSTCVMF